MKTTLALLMAIGICHAGVIPSIRLSALPSSALGLTFPSGGIVQGGQVIADHSIVGLNPVAVPSGVSVSHISSGIAPVQAIPTGVLSAPAVSGVVAGPTLAGLVGPSLSGVVSGQAISGLVAPQISAVPYASPFFGAQLSVEAPAAPDAVVDTAADSVAVEAPAEEVAAPAPEVSAEVSSAITDALAEPAPAEEVRAEEPAPVEAAPAEEAAPVEDAPAPVEDAPAPVEDAPTPVADDAPAVVLDFNNVDTPTPVEDTPEVAEARAAHLAAVEEAKARNALAEKLAAEISVVPAPVATTPVRSEIFTTLLNEGAVASLPAVGIPATYGAHVPAAYAASYAAPIANFAAPVPAPVAPVVSPVAPIVSPIAPVVTSQYHSQDELGQYSFGYAGGPSAKEEIKTVDGVTRGAYSYVDANGKVQVTSYVSDPVNGFRVTSSNLPVAPVAPAATFLEDTPEVAEAKANLLKLQEEQAKLSA